MATKPSNLAEWATGGGASITEPLLAEKQDGWPVAFKPPAQWFNWWMKLVHQWVVWLDAFETEAHTWSALQTFNAGVLAASFGAAPGTPGIRGTNAIAGTGSLLTANYAAAIKGTTSANNSGAVVGESSHAGGVGGLFKNTAANVAAIAVRAISAGYGVHGGGSAAGVYGVVDNFLGTPPADGAGVFGSAQYTGRPGVRGAGEVAGAIGGWFLGFSPGADEESGTLALFVRGGDSPTEFHDDGSGTSQDLPAGNGLEAKAGDGRGDGTSNTIYHGGTNVLRGGDIYGSENDLGQPGSGLELYGGEVIGSGVANGRRGGTAAKLIGGASDAGRGFAFEATGDGVFHNAASFDGPNLAANVAQINQVTPGLVLKAWARVEISTSKAITLTSGQNVSAVGKVVAEASSGFKSLYVDFATPLARNTRCVIMQASPYDYGANEETYHIDQFMNGLGTATNSRAVGLITRRDTAGDATVFDLDNPPANIAVLVIVCALQ